jgi:hypothetical protein
VAYTLIKNCLLIPKFNFLLKTTPFWKFAPSPNIGILLDKTVFQVCIGLRLGCNLCTPHICKCNAKVDEIGNHGLSGRFSRQTEIN